MAAVFLFGTDSADTPIGPIEQKLRPIIPDVRRIERLEDALATAENTRVIILFVSPPPTDVQVNDFIAIATRHKARVFFIWITEGISAEDYKRVARSGGAEWVSASGSFEEIREIIDRESHAQVERNASGAPALVTTFLPCLGGVGNTTVAVEVALQAKLDKKSRANKICYLDLDLQTSHICDLLDVQPRLHIEEIIDRPERMDSQLLDLFTTHHSSGLDILASPASKLDPCEVGFATLDVLFDLLLRRYDHVILDLPVFWFTWTAPILKNSNSILITARNNVPCLRQLRTTVDAVRNTVAGPAHMGVIVNQVQRQIFGKVRRRQHVNRVVEKEQVFFVREDPNAIDRANRGLPAALGGAARYAKDFTPIAKFCFEQDTNRQAPTPT